ncbi:MAG: hypothetical protein HYZ72_16840, partial [Deltaproteobacteria bacterium]|nr:hypothetical protein [Deltaproteobacteria bacterium]
MCVLPSAEAAEAFADDLRLFLGGEENGGQRVRLYPAWDVPAFEGLSPSNEILATQIEGLYALLATDTPVLVTSIEALAQRVFPQEELIAATLNLRPGQELPLSDLLDHLIQWGYRRVPLVEEKGEVSVRGGIIDLFPPLATQPLRMEFFGDTIESIRAFDPASQRSVAQAGEVTLLPMRFFSLARLQAGRRAVEQAMAESEVTHREQQRIAANLKSGLPFPGVEFLLPHLYPALESLSDYLPRGTVVWLVEPASAEAALDNYWNQLSTHAAEAHTAGHFVSAPEQLYLGTTEILTHLASRFTVALEGLENVDADLTVTTSLLTDLKAVLHAKGGEGGLAPLAERVRYWQDEHVRVFLAVSSTLQAAHLQNLLLGHGLRLPVVSTSTWQEPSLPSAAIVVGHLSQGFTLPADGLVFISEEEIFGERRHRRRARPRPVADYLTGLSQLTTGDYVVHIDHVIGIYQGLRHLSVAGTEGDYLHLEYAG